MNILDIHTHHTPSIPGTAIISTTPERFAPEYGQYYAVGIHPWHIPDRSSDIWRQLAEASTHPQVLAIGECGLDKLKGGSLVLQEEVFRAQIELASSVMKPLIIHCVRCFNELIRIRQSVTADVPWVIHGFRGKKELALQLLRHGICLSYGMKYQPEALRATPPDMLFLESDESDMPIATLYAQVAKERSMSIEALRQQVITNMAALLRWE